MHVEAWLPPSPCRMRLTAHMAACTSNPFERAHCMMASTCFSGLPADVVTSDFTMGAAAGPAALPAHAGGVGTAATAAALRAAGTDMVGRFEDGNNVS